tara:strand:- start:206 stop:376 length:171 start_codon:yes stop_codon:yes gene_type:complete
MERAVIMKTYTRAQIETLIRACKRVKKGAITVEEFDQALLEADLKLEDADWMFAAM